MTRMTRMHTRAAVAALASMFALSAPAFAQQPATKPGSSFGVGATFQRWTLSTPIGDSLRLESAEQLVAPIELKLSLGSRWTLDANGAWTSGTVSFLNATNAVVTRELSGPTDVRVRATGSFMNDAFSIALGVNAPSGRTSLDGEQLDALRVLAAPAAGMPAPVLGSGLGATVGIIVAKHLGTWALAVGATYEYRGGFTATDQLSAGISLPTEIKPGPAAHASLGLTGAVGNGEMGFYGSGDFFGTDELSVSPGTTTISSRYRLGPMYGATWTYRPGVSGVPDLALYASARVRTAYQDEVVGTIEGSGGSHASGGVSGTVLKKGGWRLKTALDARTFTGLDVDSTFVTAGFHEFGVTAIIGVPLGKSAFEPFVRYATGSVNLGPSNSSTKTLSAGARLIFR